MNSDESASLGRSISMSAGISLSTMVTMVTMALVLGCNQDQVQSTRVEKVEQAFPSPNSPPPVNANEPAPVLPRVEGNSALRWTLPKGWTEEPAGGVRFATLNPPFPGKVEVSVVALSGSAGGELANVNRWRAQLGLPPIDEPGLGILRKVVKTMAGPVSVFEFSEEGSHMVVGVLAIPHGSTWFLKLMGEDATVSQAKPDFMKLLGTLSLG